MEASGQPEPAAEISFYQIGCFTAKILPTEIAPVGRLEKSVQWSGAAASAPAAPLDIKGKKAARAPAPQEPSLSVKAPKP